MTLHWKGLALATLTLAITACQAAPRNAVVLPVTTASIRQQNALSAQTLAAQSAPVLSAKYALERAEKYALAWSSEATLTHVFGQYITQQGLPDRRRGSWTFSFINYDAPDEGFQVHMQAGRADVSQAMPASRLPRQEPLEIRAWNFDSHQLVPIIQGLFPGIQTPLPDIQLIEVDRRLVWSLGAEKWVDAMNGRRFTL